jgi:hypothetical protein
MATKRTRKEFQTPEEFEKALREDVSVSAEFDLPLNVLALMIEDSWKEDSIRRALNALRTADLVTSLLTKGAASQLAQH